MAERPSEKLVCMRYESRPTLLGVGIPVGESVENMLARAIASNWSSCPSNTSEPHIPSCVANGGRGGGGRGEVEFKIGLDRFEHSRGSGGTCKQMRGYRGKIFPWSE
jgi:hypothetical protein